jgi:hypothetical protein
LAAAVAALAGVACLACAGNAAAEPTRILVAAGNQVGLTEERPLKHADADAARVGRVMVDLGGVRPENAIVLAEPSRVTLFAALDRARAAAQKQKPEDVTLVFYFSGHGDRDAIHVGDDRVLLSELTTKLEEIPATLRIAVTDACRTTRDKGFTLDEPFAIAATSTQATGQVWIHASREGEAAQESDDLDGAIFTHAWVSGLRGAADANGDSRVTLEESFAFANAQTLIRSARSSGVVQKPEAIMSLREFGPVVLTQTTQQMANLSLPAGKDTHFLVYAPGAKSVLAEVWGLPERRIDLELPPGHYVVQRRFASVGSVAQVAVAAGEDRALGEGDFHSSSLEALAAKGDPEPDVAASPPAARRPNEVSAGYVAGGDTRTGFVQGARADYAFASSKFAVTAGGELDTSQRSLAQTSENLVTGFGRLGAEFRLPIGPATLRLGAGARVGWLAQKVQPALGGVAGGAATNDGAVVAGPEVFAGLRAPLGSTVFADVGATGDVELLRDESKLNSISGVLGKASLGARF